MLVARESFVYAVEGVEYVVKQGDQYSSNHPAAKAHPESFAPHRGAGVLAWARTHVRALVTWFVLLFIASLAIPALTKQWNDRQQELQVKESLLTDISTTSSAAEYGAVAALSKEGEPQRVKRGAVLSTWEHDRAALDPRFEVYFNGSDAASNWFGGESLAPELAPEDSGLSGALLRYVSLACCDRLNRTEHLEYVRKYLHVVAPDLDPEVKRVWSTLECGPQEQCDVDIKVYRKNYRWLGDTLLVQRDNMMGQLLKATGEGFSSGWGDFITDLNPVG